VPAAGLRVEPLDLVAAEIAIEPSVLIALKKPRHGPGSAVL
jgi:hypothetical protein